MDHVFPVTVPFPLSRCTPLFPPGIVLVEVDEMWSSAAAVALLKQMKVARRGPCLALLEMNGGERVKGSARGAY